MARLPTDLGYNAPQTARLNLNGEGYAALADAVGDLMGGLQAAQDEQDDAAALDTVVKEQATFATGHAERAAAYDGAEPGFALAESNLWDQQMDGLIQQSKGGVRRALIRRAIEGRRGVIMRATQVEAAKRAEPIQQARAAQEANALVKADIDFYGAYGARSKPIYDGFDGTKPGLAIDVLAAFDETVEAQRASVPPQYRPQWEQRMASARAKEFAQAYAIEQKGQDGIAMRGFTDNTRLLSNQLVGNPTLLDGHLARIDELGGSLPAMLRPDAVRESKALAVKSWVEGMVDSEQGEAAVEALGSGRFDTVLDPDDKARLVNFAQNRGRSELETAMAQLSARDKAEAAIDAYGRGETPDVSLDDIARELGGPYAAEWAKRADYAKKAGGATRNLPEMTLEEVQAMARAEPPDTEGPDYLVRRQVWDTSRKAALEELKARQDDPAAWAMRSTRKGDHGAQLQERLGAIETAADARGRAVAGQSYTNLMIWRQEATGAGPEAWRLLPKDMAEARVQAIRDATPENRAARLKGMAAFVEAFPVSARDNSGRYFSPRGIAVRDLEAAGLRPMEVAAVVDLGGKPARMEALAAAISFGPQTTKLPDADDERRIQEAVDREMAPFIASTEPLPGAKQLENPRRALVRVMARHLVLSQGMGPKEAAETAAKSYTEGYFFWNGLRLPKDQKSAQGGFLDIRKRLIEGGLLLPAGTRGQKTGNQAEFTGDFVKRYSRWVTNPDDAGASLMVPSTDGVWTPVLDKWGRPVVATWADAQAMQGELPPLVGPLKPPPPPPKSDKLAAPVRSTPDIMAAMSAAVRWQETRNDPARISPAGAIGAMQLKPDTARAAARRLGIAYDEKRLLNDVAYNTRLGNEELRYLTARYKHPALVLAAYNAGPNVLEPTYVDSRGRRQVGWLVRFGDPRTSGVSVDRWVASIPYAETRDYVRRVLPDAYRRLPK